MPDRDRAPRRVLSQPEPFTPVSLATSRPNSDGFQPSTRKSVFADPRRVTSVSRSGGSFSCGTSTVAGSACIFGSSDLDEFKVSAAEQSTDPGESASCTPSQLRPALERMKRGRALGQCAFVRGYCNFAPRPRPLAGAAHRQSVDSQRRLSHPHRNTLSVLAAGTHAVIQLQVIPYHAHSREHVGPVADQRGPLQRRSQLAVVDLVRLAGGEHELAGSDIHLAATEIDGVDPTLDRADDFFRGM